LKKLEFKIFVASDRSIWPPMMIGIIAELVEKSS
jgi:hypothetical protein